jgi:Tfp pilus assembly protein PilF
LAAQLFARVSSRAPRAADAWSNLGAASWARGDTALAVVGWQRALRLDPLDADSRDRLDAVHAAAVGDAAYVPPVPADVVAAAALTLWLAAWLVLALPLGRPSAALRHGAVGALALSFIVLLGGVGVER